MKTLIRTLGVLFILAVVGCQFPGQVKNGVSIQIQSPSRSIVPDWAHVADEYTISLTSTEHPQTFTRVVQTPEAVDFPGVPAGTWQVTVVATKDATIVAAGSVSDFQVTSAGGSVATVVLVGDQTGEGGYRFELQVPNDAGVTSVDAQLYDDEDVAVGSLLSPTPTVGATNTSVVFEQSNIPGGDYRLALTVKRGSVVVGQFSESVNIWTGVISGLWMAPDGSLQTTRTLALGDLAESNAYLSNLVISDHLPLDPLFSSLTTTYDLVGELSTNFSVTPTRSVDGQTIELKVGTGEWTPLASGTASSAITIESGGTFALRVTAADRFSTQEYQVAFRSDEMVYSALGADGGAPPTDATDYEVGDPVVVLGNPGQLSRDGYRFAGWNTEPDATGITRAPGSSFVSNGASLVLHPIWLENKYQFDSNPNSAENFLVLKGTGQEAPVNFVIPNGVTALFNGAVTGSLVTTVQFPSSVVSLKQNAFLFCPQLTSLTIPETVKSLGMNTFYATGLTSLNIPASVATIEAAPVYGEGFSSYTVADGHSYFAAVDGVLFSADLTRLVAVPSATTGSFVIPEGVTSLSLYLFNGTKVSSVSIPASLTNVNPVAFLGESEVTSFTISASNPNYVVIDNILFDSTGTKVVSVPPGWTGTLSFPEGTVELEDYSANSRSKVTSIQFPASLTTIRGAAIHNNFNVTTLTIPATVTSIESYAFASSYGLTSVTIEGSPTLGYGLFSNCYALELVTMESTIPPPLPEFSGMFDGCAPDLVIRVPGTAVDAYKAAQGWSEYADRIVAIP